MTLHTYMIAPSSGNAVCVYGCRSCLFAILGVPTPVVFSVIVDVFLSITAQYITLH